MVFEYSNYRFDISWMQWCPQNNAVVAIAWNDTVEILDPSIGFDRCENMFACSKH